MKTKDKKQRKNRAKAREAKRGIKIRGTGAATKGTRARGPMG